MADVADRAGVSRALVSTVFRDVPGAGPETRTRVLQAAADLGYRMDNRARMLRRNRTQLLGVVFQIQDAFQCDLVEALYPQAAAAGYHLVLSATTPDRDELSAADALLDERCEALLLVAPQSPAAQVATLSGRVPTVVLVPSAAQRRRRCRAHLRRRGGRDGAGSPHRLSATRGSPTSTGRGCGARRTAGAATARS